MKARLILTVAALLGLGLGHAAMAGPQGGHGMHSGMRPGGGDSLLALTLGLSEEQQTQLQTLEQQEQLALDSLRSQLEAGTLTREEGQQQLVALQAKHQTEIKAALTPVQQAQLDSLQALRPEARWDGEAEGDFHGPHAGRPGDLDSLQATGAQPGPGWGVHHRYAGGMASANRDSLFAAALGLSAEQQAQLGTLRQQEQQEMQQLLADLQSQVKAGTLTRQEAGQQLKALGEKHRTAFEGLLTPEQLDKLKTLRPGHDDGDADDQGPQTPATAADSSGATQQTTSSLSAEETTSPTAVESATWGTVKTQSK